MEDVPIGTKRGAWTLSEDGKWRDKGGHVACPHGRRRGRCKDCGGVGICEHGKQRFACKDCGGTSICEHGRQRSTCKDCGGVGICEHGRQRPQCKDCGGSQICEHGRRRTECKDCSGNSVLSKYKWGARDRGYSWELADAQAWWLMRQACIYCGSTEEVNGIDRDKNGWGYTQLNTVPCCSVCNYMKRTSTTTDFINHVNRIAAHTATYEQFKQRRDEIRCHITSCTVEPVTPQPSKGSTTLKSATASSAPTVANNSTYLLAGRLGSPPANMERAVNEHPPNATEIAR